MNPNKLSPRSKLPNAPKDFAREAREQAAAYDSLFANQKLELADGSMMEIPPHPDFGMLDDDRMEDYEDLLVEMDTTYDREPEIFIPEQTLDNGVTLPAETKRGELIRPYRKDGVRVKPAHSIRVVVAALGEESYAQLRAGGKCAADVWRIWGKQGLEVQQRRFQGPQTNGSTVDLETISEADR